MITIITGIIITIGEVWCGYMDVTRFNIISESAIVESVKVLKHKKYPHMVSMRIFIN